MKSARKIFTISISTVLTFAAFQTASIAGGGDNEQSLQSLLLILQTSQSEAERAFQQLNEQYKPKQYPPPPPLTGPPL